MYELLGISLVLAMLLAINVVATFMAVGVGRIIKKTLQRSSARTRAEILFALRIGPPAMAIVSIFALFIPSYVLYEPYSSGETVSKKLAALAIISSVGLTLAFWRGLRSWLATRSLLQQWLAAGVRMELSSIPVPTYRLPHAFPLIAVVGVLRPRLFIAEHVLSSLTEPELVAAIAHECGHLAARDNFKRALLRVSRAALLMVPCGRSLDRAWGEAAESAADEYAAQRSSTVALNLASALVRIARMIPEGEVQMRPALVSNFLTAGEETQGVKVRVGRLLELAASNTPRPTGNESRARMILWSLLTFVVLASAIVETRPQVLATVHGLIEQVVAFLS